MTTHYTPISNYSISRFTAQGGNGTDISHDIYRLATGAPVVMIQELRGKGHSALTIDFVDEQGHPTREALDSILAHFSAQLQ